MKSHTYLLCDEVQWLYDVLVDVEDSLAADLEAGHEAVVTLGHLTVPPRPTNTRRTDPHKDLLIS